MATLLAHIRVHPDRAERFEELARDLYQASHAGEVGLRRYEYWRGEEAGTYYTLMSFDDYAAFLAHQTSPHHEGASPALREVIQVLRLEWVDPLRGASPLPRTDSSPLPPGATDLEREYSVRFAAKVQEWWEPLRKAEPSQG